MIFTPSKRYYEYVKAVLACGHWEETGRLVKSSHAEIRHIATGAKNAYGTHDGGSEYNGPRNFATQCGRVCGCEFVQHRNRRKSRKADQLSGFVMPVESSEPEWITKLWQRRTSLLDDLLAMANEPGRPDVRRARRLAEALGEVERKLHNGFQAPPEGGWKVIEI